MATLRAVYANDFSAGLGPGWTTAGVTWQRSSDNRLQSSTATGTTSTAVRVAQAATPDLGVAYRMWRSTQRGNGTMRLARTPDASEYIALVETFGTGDVLSVQQRVGGVTTVLGTPSAPNGSLILAYTDGDVLRLSVDGGAVLSYPLGARAADARGWEFLTNTANPRWQLDDLTLYEVDQLPPLSWWDGTIEVPVEYLGWWDGATLVPSSFEHAL